MGTSHTRIQIRQWPIYLVLPVLGLISACKESVVTPSLNEQIRATGLVISPSVSPVALIKLSPGESHPVLLDPDPKCHIGFYVQGIGEDLVATHKVTGKYPAILLNSAAEDEAVETSYGAATKFRTTKSDGKLALRVESRHSSPIFAVIYTTPTN